jgi:hypothetical protein
MAPALLAIQNPNRMPEILLKLPKNKIAFNRIRGGPEIM